jgi:hypothetical protein
MGMSRVIALMVGLVSPGLSILAQDPPRPAAPRSWVAFSADVRIEMPKRPEAWGRYVQDEHGCVRQEMVHPDGSALITITNFETERMYRLQRGSWTSQPMRMGPMPRMPRQLPVTRKLEPVEGFDAYLHESTVRPAPGTTSPRGEYKRVSTVIPALNYFDAVLDLPSGERRTAVNIRLSPQSHEQFLPPPGAAVAEEAGFGGFMSFSAVVLHVAFAGQPPFEAVTTDETAYAVKTPSGIPLTLLTAITDKEKNIVRIRVLQNASGRAGNVKGDLLDEIHVPLRGTGQATRIGEGLSITVTRVGMAK